LNGLFRGFPAQRARQEWIADPNRSVLHQETNIDMRVVSLSPDGRPDTVKPAASFPFKLWVRQRPPVEKELGSEWI
jgi:hypothetical protein